MGFTDRRRVNYDTLKRRKVFAFLVAAIVSLTVGFASISVTLRINGTAKLEGRYSIHFEDYDSSGVVKNEEGYATSTVPIINQDKTELNDFSVTFYAPGDKVEFKFKIINEGNINGEISEIKISDGTFTGEDNEYVELIKNHMTKELKYVEGSKAGQSLSVGDVIAAGDEHVVSLTYSLTDFDASKMKSSVSITDLDIQITYVQSSNEVITTQENDPIEEEDDDDEVVLDYTLDSNGIIVGYDESKVTDEQGYIVIGEENELGEQIKGINQDSFVKSNVTIYSETDDITGDEIVTYVVEDGNNYRLIKEIIEENLTSSSNLGNNYQIKQMSLDDNNNSKIEKVSLNNITVVKRKSFAGSGEGTKKFVNLDTRQITDPVRNLQKLDLSGASNISSIGESVFENIGLTDLKLGNSIISIGVNAFKGNNLSTITIPASVETIGDGAFAQNNFADSSAITIEENETNNQYRFSAIWTTIGFPGEGPVYEEPAPVATDASCFTISSAGAITAYDATCGGTDVVIPSEIDGVEVKSIGNSAFRTKGLTSVYIPYTVTSIASGSSSVGAFTNNPNLTKLTFEDTQAHPSKLTTIGMNAFRGDTALTGELKLPSSVTTINGYAFYGTKFTGTLIIPATVKTLGVNLFQDNKIETLIFEDTQENPSKVTTISNSAFMNNEISTLKIPSSVTKIVANAFKNNKLRKLTIPSNVKTIGGTTTSNGSFLGNLFENGNDITVEYNETNGLTRFNESWDKIGFPGSGPTRELDDTCFTFDSSTGTITDYSNDCPKDLVIPSTISGVEVTRIGGSAFLSKKLTSVTIPYTVTTIEDGTYYPTTSSAFYGNLLSKVIFEDTKEHPSRLITIGKYSFQNNQLTNVIIPNSVTTIGEYSFQNNQLTSVTIPSSVTLISIAAFYNNQLTSVIFEDTEEHPSSLKQIYGQAFYNNQLTSITIPSSVTTLILDSFGNNQFSTINDITIGYNEENLITRFDKDWENIGFPTSKFGCYTVSPSERNKITGYAADGESCGYDVVIPSTIGDNTITTIGKSAFYNKQLTSVTIPNSITTIEERAFENNQLASVTIPNSVTTIEQNAFCNNILRNLVIPESVTIIGQDAFSYNMFMIADDITVEFNETNLLNRFDSDWTSIGFPSKSVKKYGCYTINPGMPNKIEKYDNTCSKDVVIPSEIEGIHIQVIGAYAFQNNQLTSVTIPNSVTTIEQNAFRNNQLTSIVIPNSVKSIGNYVFENNQLTSVTISNGLTEIGEGAFRNNQLTSIVIPNSVTTIKPRTFYGNQLIGTISIPSGVTTIGYSAFDSNPQLSTIVLKRSDSTGITLGSNWNGTAEVIYDPNYEG